MSQSHERMREHQEVKSFLQTAVAVTEGEEKKYWANLKAEHESHSIRYSFGWISLQQRIKEDSRWGR